MNSRFQRAMVVVDKPSGFPAIDGLYHAFDGVSGWAIGNYFWPDPYDKFKYVGVPSVYLKKE